MRTIMMVLVSLAFALPAAEVEVGNLIYAGNKTSKCFADHFLKEVRDNSSIDTDKAFKKVRLDDLSALARTPFAIMNGQGGFTLRSAERENLERWLSSGGFLVASAGCSDSKWGGDMRRELVTVFGEDALQPIDTTHAMFHTMFDIDKVPLKSGKQARFEGVVLDGRLVCLFSAEGLNNTAKVKGCCCCGGDEVKVSAKVVANALVYSLVE